MKNVLMYGIGIILIFISCKEHPGKASTATGERFKLPGKEVINPCIDPALHECIKSYCVSYVGEADWYYVPVWFFQKDSACYFTIWRDVGFPESLMKVYNPNILFKYYWFQLEIYDIVLITRADPMMPLPFDTCIDELGTAKAEDLPKKMMSTMNSFDFRTYKYYFSKGKCHVEALRDTIYLDWEKPRSLDYEMKFLKMENEMKQKEEKEK